MYVVDASVLVKWFANEPDTPNALALKAAHVDGSFDLVTLDFALLELANLLPNLVCASIQLAARMDVTVYDAAYVALAQDLDWQLVTADRKLHRAIAPLRRSALLTELTSSH